MSIEKRIEKLEKSTGVVEPQIVILFRHRGQPEPTEAQVDAAIADFKAKNPDWEERGIVLQWQDGQFEPAYTMHNKRS